MSNRQNELDRTIVPRICQQGGKMLSFCPDLCKKLSWRYPIGCDVNRFLHFTFLHFTFLSVLTLLNYPRINLEADNLAQYQLDNRVQIFFRKIVFSRERQRCQGVRSAPGWPGNCTKEILLKKLKLTWLPANSTIISSLVQKNGRQTISSGVLILFIWKLWNVTSAHESFAVFHI